VSYLAEELAKYSSGLGKNSKKGKGAGATGGGGRKKDDKDVLDFMNAFRGRLKGVGNRMGMDGDDDDAEADQGVDPDIDVGAGTAGEASTEGGGLGLGAAEDPGMEIDDDRGFMTHSLHFPKDNSEEVNKAERDYEVIDPRVRGARAKEEERRKREESKRGRGGGGGGRYRR
jgi:peptidyl-prolyl cis-trans isomerase SDCCAG10